MECLHILNYHFLLNIQGLKKELEKARELVGESRHIGADLCNVCGEPGAVEVQKQLEDLGHMIDEVNDAIRDRGDELRKAFQHADQFKKLLEVCVVVICQLKD